MCCQVTDSAGSIDSSTTVADGWGEGRRMLLISNTTKLGKSHFFFLFQKPRKAELGLPGPALNAAGTQRKPVILLLWEATFSMVTRYRDESRKWLKIFRNLEGAAPQVKLQGKLWHHFMMMLEESQFKTLVLFIWVGLMGLIARLFDCSHFLWTLFFYSLPHKRKHKFKTFPLIIWL